MELSESNIYDNPLLIIIGKVKEITDAVKALPEKDQEDYKKMLARSLENDLSLFDHLLKTHDLPIEFRELHIEMENVARRLIALNTPFSVGGRRRVERKTRRSTKGVRKTRKQHGAGGLGGLNRGNKLLMAVAGLLGVTSILMTSKDTMGVVAEGAARGLSLLSNDIPRAAQELAHQTPIFGRFIEPPEYSTPLLPASIMQELAQINAVERVPPLKNAGSTFISDETLDSSVQIMHRKTLVSQSESNFTEAYSALMADSFMISNKTQIENEVNSAISKAESELKTCKGKWFVRCAAPEKLLENAKLKGAKVSEYELALGQSVPVYNPENFTTGVSSLGSAIEGIMNVSSAYNFRSSQAAIGELTSLFIGMPEAGKGLFHQAVLKTPSGFQRALDYCESGPLGNFETRNGTTESKVQDLFVSACNVRVSQLGLEAIEKKHNKDLAEDMLHAMDMDETSTERGYKLASDILEFAIKQGRPHAKEVQDIFLQMKAAHIELPERQTDVNKIIRKIFDDYAAQSAIGKKPDMVTIERFKDAVWAIQAKGGPKLIFGSIALGMFAVVVMNLLATAAMGPLYIAAIPAQAAKNMFTYLENKGRNLQNVADLEEAVSNLISDHASGKIDGNTLVNRVIRLTQARSLLNGSGIQPLLSDMTSTTAGIAEVKKLQSAIKAEKEKQESEMGLMGRFARLFGRLRHKPAIQNSIAAGQKSLTNAATAAASHPMTVAAAPTHFREIAIRNGFNQTQANAAAVAGSDIFSRLIESGVNYNSSYTAALAAATKAAKNGPAGGPGRAAAAAPKAMEANWILFQQIDLDKLIAFIKTDTTFNEMNRGFFAGVVDKIRTGQKYKIQDLYEEAKRSNIDLKIFAVVLVLYGEEGLNLSKTIEDTFNNAMSHFLIHDVLPRFNKNSNSRLTLTN